MSVVHEALKRAGGKSNPPPAPSSTTPLSSEQPALTVKSTGKQPVWLFWLMLFFVLAEAALCWREHTLRLRSEDKMRASYLELNDARGQSLEKTSTVRRAASDLRELRLRLTEVETENLKKERKISDLTKRLHESEMEKIRLSEFSSK